MKGKFYIILLLLGIIFLVGMPVKAATPSVDDVSRQLICQCGCTSVLNNCTHAECHSRESMTTLIKQEIDQGQSGEQIVQLFVAQYGEQVLASPPKKGFNLTAWLLPFAAILAGGVIVYVVLKKWVRRGTQLTASTTAGMEENNTEYEHQLEKDLKEFNGGGFR